MNGKRGRILKHLQTLDAAEVSEVMTEAMSAETLKELLLGQMHHLEERIITDLWEWLALDEMSQDEINAEEARWLSRNV